jgi:hypothetical protein
MRNTTTAARNATFGEFSGVEGVDGRASSVFNATDRTPVHVRLNGTVRQFSVIPADTGTAVSIAYFGDWAENRGYYRFETLTDREQRLFGRVLDSSPEPVKGPHPEELMHFTPSGDAVSPGDGLFYVLKNTEIYRLRVFVN